MESQSYFINFVGDVMLGRLIDQLFPIHVHQPNETKRIASFVHSNPQLKNYGVASPWGDTLPIFDIADLNVINLETSVTASNMPWPNKAFNYRLHPDNIKALHVPQINYASLANNHTLDFGEQGLQDTVEALQDAGVSFAGAGLIREEAVKPAVLSLPSNSKKAASVGKIERKLAIWSASDHPSDWSRVPGFHLIDYSSQSQRRLKDLIGSTTPLGVSLKIFSVHWGPNYAWRPTAEIQSLAHFLIDECGIDIIHGHSSHHIQGIEMYKKKLIIYGCGDFVDDYALTPTYRNDLSGIWQVKLKQADEELVLDRLELFPTRISKFQALRLPRGESDHRWVYDKFKGLCAELGTEVDECIGEQGEIVIQW